ncbi:MAG: cytochrome c family protein [candidate division KSB1 bacterium]|nr:cytochrome c family protein [candidate division KSB1 bacterium]MDZ7303513.1 cytochrome c family protein [candidate division KSB1 bacterium]MDZ7312685.1 cytochrome c family protein [candidate division KSB1 bacterium]
MKFIPRLAVVVIALLILPALIFGQSKAKYVGSKACMPCHMTPKSGAAYKIWQGSAHAKAFATLATPAALEIAKKKGIAEPQKDLKCLKCHDTAAGVAAAQLAPTFKAGEGVGCEVCHGAGSEYKTMQIMKDLVAGKVKPEDVGLVKPDEKTCLKCHNTESPTYKPFNFAEASKKIAHPTPKQ